jgi:hypothetical protein
MLVLLLNLLLVESIPYRTRSEGDVVVDENTDDSFLSDETLPLLQNSSASSVDLNKIEESIEQVNYLTQKFESELIEESSTVDNLFAETATDYNPEPEEAYTTAEIIFEAEKIESATVSFPEVKITEVAEHIHEKGAEAEITVKVTEVASGAVEPFIDSFSELSTEAEITENITEALPGVFETYSESATKVEEIEARTKNFDYQTEVIAEEISTGATEVVFVSKNLKKEN